MYPMDKEPPSIYTAQNSVYSTKLNTAIQTLDIAYLFCDILILYSFAVLIQMHPMFVLASNFSFLLFRNKYYWGEKGGQNKTINGVSFFWTRNLLDVHASCRECQ